MNSQYTIYFLAVTQISDLFAFTGDENMSLWRRGEDEHGHLSSDYND